MEPLVPSVSPPLTPEMLDRYLSGESTADEARIVQASLARYPNAADALRQGVRLAGQVPAGGVETPDPAEQWAQLTTRLGWSSHDAVRGFHESTSPQRAPAPRTVPRMHTKMSRTVVLSTLAVALVIVFVHWTDQTALATQRFETRPGQRSVLHLADGSVVLLAPASTATISGSTIDLVGEAQLTVAEHASRALVIRTRNAVVQVLGTRFLVRQYANDAASRIVVNDGRVAVQSLQSGKPGVERAVLAAGMMARVTDSTMAVTKGIAVDDYAGWTTGRLVFDREPLRDVAAELSRVYGVDVRVSDSVLARRIMTMEVTVAKEPLEAVLNIIGLAHDAHVRQDSGAFMLVPGRASLPSRETKRLPQPEYHYGR